MKILQSIPTNIITGFLGVGKTTAILQLLKQKPVNERWAILVNEFGEIGIDGALLESKNDQSTVFISEVAGGCMCCASKVPMQIALNQLLKKSRPDRLLIEPTGLGHPKEVKTVLTSAHYQSILKLGPTITLVDARNIDDNRYTSHEIFNEQLQIADILVANKQNLYANGQLDRLKDYLNLNDLNKVPLFTVDHGAIKSRWLNTSVSVEMSRTAISGTTGIAGIKQTALTELTEQAQLEQPALLGDYAVKLNISEGFHSIGWQFSADKMFNHQKLMETFNRLTTLRIKALLNTDIGYVCYNQSTDDIEYYETEKSEINQLEMIAEEIIEKNWTNAVLQCLKSHTNSHLKPNIQQ